MSVDETTWSGSGLRDDNVCADSGGNRKRGDARRYLVFALHHFQRKPGSLPGFLFVARSFATGNKKKRPQALYFNLCKSAY